MEREEIILKICDFLVDKPVSKAYLFGSYARNQQTENSDIDIVAYFDSGTTLFDTIFLQQKLSELLNKKIDLISSNGISKYVLPYINKEKLLIYER